MKSVCHFLLALCFFHSLLPAQSQSYIIAGQTSGPNISHQLASPGDSLPSCFCPSPATIDLDLDGDAARDFQFVVDGYWGNDQWASQDVYADGSNTIQRTPNSFGGSVFGYAFGDTIYPTTLPDDTLRLCTLADAFALSYNGWPGDQDSLYMGVRFHAAQGWVLGWVQVVVDLGPEVIDTMFPTPWPRYYNYTTHVIDWAFGHTYVGIDDEADSGLELYPVPAMQHLQVRFTKGVEVRAWRIIDLTGKTQMEGGELSGAPLDVSGLSSGMYVFELMHDGRTARKKFLVDEG